MLTVPTTTRQSRRNLPPGRVGKGLLMARSGNVATQDHLNLGDPEVAVRAVWPCPQPPTELDLPIAA